MAESPAAGKNRVDLRTLVAHRHALAASTPVEVAQAEFARHDVDFLGVMAGEKFAGVCARRELVESLGSRFGFALNAKRPVAEHLMAAPLRVSTADPITSVFQAASARDHRAFYDDVVLVDEAGGFAGLIPMRTLVRLQTEFLVDNIARVEAAGREIAARNREMEDDLQMAREVQLALLPPPPPPLAGGDRVLTLAHRYRPAGGISGDFFATIPVSDQSVGLLICDVMGHGVRSALVTAMVRAMLESLQPIAADPGRLLTQLNRDLTRILRRSGGLIFVTAAYAVLDLESDRLRYGQAGHPTPLRWDAASGTMQPVRCSDADAGPALGLIDDFDYATVEDLFAPGDRLVLFTDGVVEAAARDGEEYGPDRLARALGAHAAATPEAWLDHLLADVGRFAGGTFGDDVCLLAAALEPAAQPLLSCTR